MGGVELGGDGALGLVLSRGAGRRMSMRRAGTSGPYLRASSGSSGPVVDDAYRVTGEVRGFDHPGPRAGLEGGEDVLTVLLVLVAARLSGRVGDCGDQGCGAGAEPPGQHRQGGLSAAGGDTGRVVFDSVVQQASTRHVGVGDPVVAQDPDRDPQQMDVMPSA
jgi:hypothetical protein